ncbi:restriction endonuclease subunit S [Proteus mirabilis]|nr:restriction endonuclease subunit S [Proteus mirabilis]MCL8600195.1 restriction endonuclease subunit S [Proteus mirabilis]
MVPEGWESKKLGSISSLVTSGSRDWAQFYSDTGSKFIRMTNLRRDSIYLKMDDLKFVDVNSDSADGKRTSLQTGDILISITAELGKIGWIHFGLGQAFINQHTALVRVKPKDAESKFIAYLLCSGAYHRRINSLNDAGAKAGLNLATIRTLDITLPPLHEQKKIAQILSTWDNAISATEQLLDNSQQQKKALMQQLLTGKKRLVNPDTGKVFEGDWKNTHLSNIASIKKGKALSAKNLVAGSYPVIAGGKSSPYSHVHFTHENVITVSASGAYAGYVSYHPYKIWASDCSVVTAKPANYLGFIFQWLQLNQIRIYSMQSGGAQPHIYPKDLEVMKLRVPKIEEQQKIASVLTAADKEIELLQAKLAHLKDEKKALMQQLLTGKRRVKVDENVVA